MSTTYTRRTFTRSDASNEAKKKLDDHNAAPPGPYDSRWLPRMDAALEEYLARPDFSYDLESDPLYQQYRTQYTGLGKLAMEDTLGLSAALTGGYGNSWGAVAGQQAYNGYLQQLNNMIPQLYQLALDTYDRQGQRLQQNYGMLSDREGLDYSRWLDGLGQWQDQRDYLAGRYDAERGFDYTEFRDLVGDDQWLAAFEEDIRRFDFANKLGEFAELASGGGGYGYSYGGGTPKPKEKDEEKKETPKNTGSTVPYKAPYTGRISVASRPRYDRYTNDSY